MLELLFKLLVGHAIADFGLQSDWMSKNKNRNYKSNYVPEGQKYTQTWFYVLGAHSLMHGGMVYLMTGVFAFGLVETVVHFVLDFLKCENLTNPHIDQFFHIIWKVAYALNA